MADYEHSTIRVDGYIFDTWAIQRAFTELDPPSRPDPSEYDEKALEAVLDLFCDWSPAREYDSPANAYSALNTDAENSLAKFSEEQQRAFYENLCEKISESLNSQYGIDATETSVKRFAEALTVDGAKEQTADFLLAFLLQYSQYLAEFDPNVDAGATDDSALRDLLIAIQRLPDEYLDVKHTQYGGEEKINGIRHVVADEFLSGNDVTVSQFRETCQQENRKYDKAILTGYSLYSILGQLHYDYAKLRIDRYLDRLSSHLQEELGVESHSVHTCSFVEPRNQLTQFAWIALHPGDEGFKDEYQLYLGVKPSHLRYGLHVGKNLQDGAEWTRHRDLVTRNSSESCSINSIRDKLREVKEEYATLNGLKDSSRPSENSVERPAGSEQIARQLKQNGQLVFYGPPGTGKTYQAEQFAEWWADDGASAAGDVEQFRAVTFHPSFTYEDFLEGLSANATDQGMVEYGMEAGVFKSIAEDAKEAYKNAGDDAPRFVLVIDEINRGNLAQIFGETITQLETDKRLDATNELEVNLAHSGDPFGVPPNLYVIGTMNTADRSIALVDAALRRRFRFMYFPPDYEALATRHGFEDRDEVGVVAEADAPQDRVLLALSIEALETINSRILESANLGKGKQIGHSYLWNCATTDDVATNVQTLVDTWKYEILPLLEEYFFGQFERLQQDVFAGEGGELLDVERQRVVEFDQGSLRRTLAAITDHAGKDASTTPTDSP